MTITDLKYPMWERDYLAALLETDPEVSVERVAAAECSMIERLRHIAEDQNSAPERQAIRDALANLRMMQPADWRPAEMYERE